MYYLRSNIPPKMFYSGYKCEIFRTVRKTGTKLVFSSNSKKLITRKCKQGGRIETFSYTLAKVYGKHFQKFQKFFPNFSLLRK